MMAIASRSPIRGNPVARPLAASNWLLAWAVMFLAAGSSLPRIRLEASRR